MWKLTWEVVGMNHLHLFCDADPLYYAHTAQTVPNSEIPDMYWMPVSREDTWESINEQYIRLKQWADADKEFVRNVQLWELEEEPKWKKVN